MKLNVSLIKVFLLVSFHNLMEGVSTMFDCVFCTICVQWFLEHLNI